MHRGGGLCRVQEATALWGLVKGTSLTSQCEKKRRGVKRGKLLLLDGEDTDIYYYSSFSIPFQVSHLRSPPSSAQPRALFKRWQERGRDGAGENSVNTELHVGPTGCPL